MKSLRLRFLIATAALALAVLATGCAKKAVEAPPTTATPPPAPTPPPVVPETPPTPAPTPAPAPTPSAGASDLQPVFFDYDSDAIRDDARGILDANARFLRDHADARAVIEGHCDERGTAEYNQALGERRAQAARDYLVRAGIPQARLRTISYGKERPFAEGHDESAWAQNRRAQFASQ